MKNIFILLLSLMPYLATSQISFNTGNRQLDSDLNAINASANLNIRAFKSDLSISYNITEKKIEYMHGTLKMSWGDIYLVLEISKISKTSVDRIISVYEKHRSKGWGYIAKEVGIKPGSAEFHQLKGNTKNKRNNHKNFKKPGKGKEKNK